MKSNQKTRDQKTSRRFRTIVIMTLIVMFMEVGNFIRGIYMAKKVRTDLSADYALSVRNSAALTEVRTKQDIYRQQYLQYIEDTIAFMQQLQDQNKGRIKVPRAPVPRPLAELPSHPITDLDLRRIPQPGPVAPTPTPKVIEKKVFLRKKSTPTPKPWYKRFEQTR